MTPAVDREGASEGALKVAYQLVDDNPYPCLVCEMDYGTGAGKFDPDDFHKREVAFVEAIARALDAERERAAKVCDERAKKHLATFTEDEGESWRLGHATEEATACRDAIRALGHGAGAHAPRSVE